MNRKEFIKATALIGSSLLLPSFAFKVEQTTYSREQLIGKGNPDIAGDTYTTTMHVETSKAFAKMKAAAVKDGILLEVVSAYRSFHIETDLSISEAKNLFISLLCNSDLKS